MEFIIKIDLFNFTLDTSSYFNESICNFNKKYECVSAWCWISCNFWFENLKKKPVMEKCYTPMLGILSLETNILLVKFNLILSWQNPPKLGQGICGFHWVVVFSYLRYASLDVPLLWEIQLSQICALVNFLGWWDHSSQTSELRSWSNFIDKGLDLAHHISSARLLQGKCSLPSWLLFFFFILDILQWYKWRGGAATCVLAIHSTVTNWTRHCWIPFSSLLSEALPFLCFFRKCSPNIFSLLFPSLHLKKVLIP